MFNTNLYITNRYFKTALEFQKPRNICTNNEILYRLYILVVSIQ